MNASLRNGLCLSLMVIFFTACGPAPTPPPTPEPTLIRFAYAGHDSDFQALADDFHEQYPDLTIELVPVSLREQVGGGDFLLEQFEESDIVRVKINFLGQEQLDAILPLDDFLSDSETFPSQDFFPGSLEALQYKQRQLGVPAGLDPVVMYYENIRFRAASATPPDPDYTLEDFLASARQVNNPSASIESGNLSYGFCTTPLFYDPVAFAYMFGGGIFDQMPEPTKPTLNSPANAEALAWYARLWSEYALAPKVTSNEFQTYQQVGSSLCGFWLNWMDMFGFANSYTIEGRVLPLPRVDESSPDARSAPSYQDGYFITKYSPNPEAAWLWINYLLERQDASLNLIPPLTWQIDSDEYALRAAPDTLAVAQRLPADMPFLSLSFLQDPRTSDVSNLFQEAARRVVLENVDVQTALDEAQTQAEEIFSGNAQP